MKTIVAEYVYYFEYLRDYFECHELLEEFWKNKPEFTKQDFEVGLILLATGQYHMRRGNITGDIAHCRKQSESSNFILIPIMNNLLILRD